MSNFEKVIGYKSLKLELERIVDILNNPSKYKELGVSQERGICLVGAPGVGKSLIATSFIEALPNRKSYIIRKTKSNGDFIKYINDTFNDAKNNEPSIVLLDDMDKFANNDCSHLDADEFATIQSLIDENKDKDLFVIATCNSHRAIPRSLLRPGRLKEIRVDVPRGQDAIDIITHYVSSKKFISEIDTTEIARILTGSSCAEIETVINQAGMYAGYENRKTILRGDLINACLRVIHECPELIDYENDAISEKVSVHEAGHVIISELLEPNSVNLVSIKNYDDGIGGVTYYYQDDEYWSDMKFMEHRVMSLLAGKAATEVVYGVHDVGCNSDLHRAFDVVARFVDNYCAYGFDKFITEESSDELKRRKEDAIASELNKYYIQTKRMIVENRIFLDKVAKSLFKNKVLSSNDVQEIKKSLSL